MSDSSIWPIDRNLSSATNPSQRGTVNDDNEEILLIPPGRLVLYPEPSLEKSYPSAETQSVYFSVDWAIYAYLANTNNSI